ncbi:Bifunctional nitrilase/nitrile hydratase NIT4A [Bienertia sinuspersici]
MALVSTSGGGDNGPMFAEVEMVPDSSAPTVRATVVQASTVFYDTPSTLGLGSFFSSSVSLITIMYVVRPVSFGE